jgi:tRNA threonylcarbamoyladenosine biosynthesis protein TsaB
MPHSPILLAIDTATARCSVALAYDASVHVQARDAGQRHTEFLLPMVDALLMRHGVALQDCAAIAFGAGPGSFTGLRVACGTAQGLAFGIDRPVVAVGNLDAAALDAFARVSESSVVCVAVDARMHEVYCAVFTREGPGVRMLAAPAIAAPGEVVALAALHRADTLVGNALAVYADELGRFGGWKLADVEADAGSIARLALQALELGNTVEPAAAAPLYVRNRVALTIDERRQGVMLAGQGST